MVSKKDVFDDPLEDVDPVMEGAFSSQSGRSASNQFNDDDAYEEDSLDYDPFEDDASNLGQDISDVQFPTLNPEETGQKVELDVFSNIPVNLSVELGRSQISLKEVFELTEGSIIELERLVGEPLDLVVNGQVVAQGEVVAIDNNYGLRVTNILASVR